MNQPSTAAESRYMGMVKGMRCLICRRHPDLDTKARAEVHHIAQGSSRQCNWLVAPLCAEHHRGGSGLHGLGSKRFCDIYKVPHGTEYGLLAWVNEDLLGLKAAA